MLELGCHLTGTTSHVLGQNFKKMNGREQRLFSSSRSFVLVLMMIGIIGLVWGQELDAKSCEALGFKSSELSCATCKEFSLFLNEKKIIDDCNKCCQEVVASEKAVKNKDEKEFVSGTLLMCYCNIRSFPEVESFMNNEAKQFNNLQVSQRQGIMPTLIMKRKDGSEESNLISHWKLDDIKEYLTEKLVQ